MDSILSVIAEFVKRKNIMNEFNYENIKYKREHLVKVYEELSRIILLFPEENPNEFLGLYGPYYMCENFDVCDISLEYQINDLLAQKSNRESRMEYTTEIDIQINNKKVAKKKLAELKERYECAATEFNEFKVKNRHLIELHASYEVRNILVLFEVTIHNMFISGHTFDENVILINRTRLINYCRDDLGWEYDN